MSCLYCIAGDMVQGSLIDAEYKGISTMEIMNYLSPDVVEEYLRNHQNLQAKVEGRLQYL